MSVKDAGTADLTSDSILEETGKILTSDVFRDSPVQKRLLRFLVDETMAGRADTLKEYTIGTLVFQRSDSYDPKSESIVRVQIGVLRRKLSAYYAGQGIQDPVRIALPKGQYTPEFRSAPAPVEVEPSIPRTVRDGKPFLLATAGFAAALVVVLIGWTVLQRVWPHPANPWRSHPLWYGFFEPSTPAKLVLGSAIFYYVPGSGLIVRDNHIQMPDSPDTKARISKLESEFGTKLQPADIYTGIGDAVAAYTMGRFFNQYSQLLPIEPSRQSRWEDVVSGNLIIVASLRFYTLRQELHFPTAFQLDSNTARITLSDPGPGEQKEYSSVFSGHETGTDYALISVWPGTASDRRIMTVGGLFTWGTAGAAHFITTPGALRNLGVRLQKDMGKFDPGKGLQVLIRVDVKDGQPIQEEYVTHRWLAPK